MIQERPKVGVGVIIIKGKEVLIGKRKNAHGEGTWASPGGHLEYFETLEECALREVKEETGLEVKIYEENQNFSNATTNDRFSEGKHYVTLFVRTDYINGEPEVMEPNKCERWKWVEWNKLPDNLFLTIKNLTKQGYNLFD